MQGKRSASATPIASDILNFDLFRHPFRFMLPNGYDSVKSKPGRIATLLLVILTIGYGTINMLELSDYGKTTMRLDVIDYYYSDTDVFNIDKTPGLNIAFGVTHYDNNTEKLDNLDYGEVIGEIKRWDGENHVPHLKLKLRPCTKEELGLDTNGESENAKFYPSHGNSKRYFDLYWKKLQCYDEIVKFRGEFNSASAENLMFYFNPCDNSTRSTCKTAQEIEDFTKNFYYIHVHNSVRFEQTGYGDEKMVKESRFTWTRIRPNLVGDETIYAVHNKEIRLQDSRLFQLS